MGTGILSCCKNKNEDNLVNTPDKTYIVGLDNSYTKGNLLEQERNDSKNENVYDKRNTNIYKNTRHNSNNEDNIKNIVKSNKKGEVEKERDEPHRNSALYTMTENSNNNINIMNENKTEGNEDDYRSIKSLFFYMKKFQMVYKHYDDFGLVFDPVLNFKLTSEIEVNFDQKATEEEEALINDEGNEYEGQTPDGVSGSLSPNIFPSSGVFGKNVGKIFFFEGLKVLDVQKMEDWPFKKLKITILNKSKSQQYNSIRVGVCFIPLIALLEEGCIEGKFIIRSKMVKEIGYLYMRIKCIQSEEEMMKLNTLNDTQNIKDEEETNIQAPNLKNVVDSLILPVRDKIIDFFKMATSLDYGDLDQTLQNKFKLKKIDVLGDVKDTEKGMDDRKSKQIQEDELHRINSNPLTVEEFAEIMAQAIIKQQHQMIYGLLNYLINRIVKKDINFLNVFLDIMQYKKNNNELDLFNCLIFIFPSNNFVLIKQFNNFLYRLIEYYREIEIDQEILNTRINFEELFNILHNNFGHFHQILQKVKDLKYEEMEELNESIYWMLNSVLLLLTPNVDEKLIKVDIISKLYSIGFKNCITLITKPRFIIKIFMSLKYDSDVTSLVIKIFRKGIQILLDDKNNMIQNSDNPKTVSTSIKDLLVDEEKAYDFLFFIQMALTSYLHYPEVFTSILLILIYFCEDYKYPIIIRRILDNLEISLLCSGFDFYRGNLRKIGKNINFFFYKFISHITEISKGFEEEETIVNFKASEIKEITNEFLKLWRMKATSKDGESFEKGKNVIYLIKNTNLELHEVFCCIAANLTRNTDACKSLCKDKCYFIQHIIEYLFEMNRDNIKKFLEKFKSNRLEKAALYVSIIDNSINMFDNLITKSTITKEFFMKFLYSRNITKNKVKYHISDLLDTAITTLNYNNQKLKRTADFFINNFD